MRNDPRPEDCAGMARNCLSASLRRTERIVTRHYDAHLAASGLTAVQLPILASIASIADPTFRTLAEQLDLDRSTLSRNLALLSERRLVTIAPSAGPKAGRISLTPTGRAALRKAYALWRDAQKELETTLSAGGLADALDLLKALRRAVRPS